MGAPINGHQQESNDIAMEKDKTSPIVDPLQNNLNRILRNWKLVFVGLITLVIIILIVVLTVTFVRKPNDKSLGNLERTTLNSTDQIPNTTTTLFPTLYRPSRTDNSTTNYSMTYHPEKITDNSSKGHLVVPASMPETKTNPPKTDVSTPNSSVTYRPEKIVDNSSKGRLVTPLSKLETSGEKPSTDSPATTKTLIFKTPMPPIVEYDCEKQVRCN